MSKNLNQLSEQLLLAVKMQESTSDIKLELEKKSFNELEGFSDDNTKKAFWINIYNAFFLILRKEQKVEKPAIYKKKLIRVANINFSLDDIEHGILRRYRYKYSLGFLRNFFALKLIKDLAVSEVDYRIHFALNCGAKSCPPIAFYNLEKIDTQLNLATQSFLEGETDFYPDKKEVHISMLFKWYLGDFKGTKGIKKIYLNQLNRDISTYNIKFKPYSWEEDLDNFS